MNKILTAALGVAASLGFAVSTMGAAGATSYGATWVTPVSATVPVNCTFLLPSISIGAVTFLAQSDFDTQDNVPNVGGCNVNFSTTWSSVNGLTSAGGGKYNGVMNGKDTGGNTHHLDYKFTPGFNGGNAQTIVGGIFDLDIPYTQGDAYGGVTYSDTIQLTINYT